MKSAPAGKGAQLQGAAAIAEGDSLIQQQQAIS